MRVLVALRVEVRVADTVLVPVLDVELVGVGVGDEDGDGEDDGVALVEAEGQEVRDLLELRLVDTE